MVLKSLSLKNFRAFKDETRIKFNSLTTIIGKNDVGKSTILESLEIFFNNKAVKIDSSDVHVKSTEEIVEITCEFISFPTDITLDSTSKTCLKEEYLLSKEDSLNY